jgi:hypothetical protein
VNSDNFFSRMVRRLPLNGHLLKIFEQQGEMLAQKREILAQQGELLAQQRELLAQIDSCQQAIRDAREAETGHADLIMRAITQAGQAQIPQLTLLGANVTALATRQDEAFRAMRHRMAAACTAGAGADLYLDLLEAALTGALYKDVS